MKKFLHLHAANEIILQMLMDVIPLDATLVKGSHGRRPADKKDWPVFITSQPEFLGAKEIESTDAFQILLRQVLQ
jgi:hypothetical protein